MILFGSVEITGNTLIIDSKFQNVIFLNELDVMLGCAITGILWNFLYIGINRSSAEVEQITFGIRQELFEIVADFYCEDCAYF